MDKCHYYLSNGLWKIAECYFTTKINHGSEYFWGMATAPNKNSFGSHIVSTPWQQSWVTLEMLEAPHQLQGNRKDPLNEDDVDILRKEINVQYTLRNYSSDTFVQQLFNMYSKIQTHQLLNYSDAEMKAFVTKLKILLNVLLKNNPSEAHTLMSHMLQYGFFLNCCENILSNVIEDDSLCSLLLSSFCKLDDFQLSLPFIVNLSQTEFQYQLNLILLSSDKIKILQSIIEEEKKIYLKESISRLNDLTQHGLQPNRLFHDMIIMEKHFLIQILNLVKDNLEDFWSKLKCQRIPTFIWPLVLLQCWDSGVLSDDSLLQLIDKCKESTKDKTLVQITFILEWYLNFCKWCERHGASEHRSTEKEQNLLQKAKEHSVLYLINNTTDLSETDWSQIRELLNQGKPKSDGSKQWDIVLFDGYCILMLVLHSILSSAELDILAKLQKMKMTDINHFNNVFQSLYNEEVTERLKSVKKMVKQLYPLNFRLEVLENIFSLIFITFEDVKSVSYFLKGTVDLNKGVEKIQARSKSVPTEKSESSKLNRSLSLPPHHALITEKEEEGEAKKAKSLKGFICKKYILRDLIYLVKECLDQLEADPSSQSDKFQGDVPCSIKNTQMENRLDRLTESVSEATWRLQLVTDPDFVSQSSIGTMQYACGQDPHHHFDPEWIYIPYDHDRSGLIKSRKKSSTVEKPNDSGSQSQSSPGNGNSSGELQNVKHKAPGPGVMNQMLAYDSSLVVHCLSQGDVLNADHIIQMMSTEENRQTLEGELHFTESINDLKKKLLNISVESPVKKSAPEAVSKSWSLQSIQIIANQGVNSTALTNHVERFLSINTLPGIQGASKVSVGSMLQCIENGAAIVTIDLALTAAATFQDFNDLLNIASKHCPELNTRVQPPISPQTTFTKPLGYIVFAQNVISLLQEINRSQISDSDLEISFQQFLRSHQYPFSLKSLKETINFWKQLKSAMLDFETDAVENHSLADTKEGKSQKNIKDTQKIFESVMKVLETSSEFLDLGKLEASTSEIAKNVNYCDLLSKYLNDISTFIFDNIPLKSDVATEPVTFHSLLEQSAVEIVDKLIFHYHIEPGVLEKKAQQLGFNLSASLIAGCCPRLPQTICPPETAKCPSSDRIVLNELVPDYKSLEHQNPARVVESILKELLIAFENYTRNKQVDGASSETKNILVESDILELRNDFKIQKILEKTLELNFINLQTLNPNETLPFFINLYNLIMCHCCLSSKLEKTDGIYFNLDLYREIGLIFLGYNVGELGYVSVYDLRNRIVGEEVSNFSIRRSDSWSNVNIPIDARANFALVNFRSSSPKLRLYTSDKIEEQLNDAVSTYLQFNVSLTNLNLVISNFLNFYFENILLNQEPESQSGGGLPSDKIKILCEFLSDHAGEELKDQLRTSPVSNLSVEVRPDFNEFVLVLGYNSSLNSGREVRKIWEEKWMNRTLNDSILRHLSQSSRILADIVQKIHEAKEPPETEVARDVLTEEKLKYLDALFNASWLHSLAPLFNGNHVITALNKCPSEEKLVEYFQNCIRVKNWKGCLDVLFALPDYCVFSDLNIKRLRDVVLCERTNSASKEGEENPWYYSQHILDVNIRLETVVNNCKYWPGPVCISHLSSILRDFPSLTPIQASEIRFLIRKIRIYHSIVQFCSDFSEKSWFDVASLSNSSPRFIIQSLAKANQLELCLQWTSLPGVLTSIRQFIDSEFILLLFNHLSHEFELIDQLLNSLPVQMLTEIFDKVIGQLVSLPSISHLVQFALRFEPSPKYRLIVISVDMLNSLDVEEQSRLLHLISSPLLIVEQLLMNTSLDALEKVLRKVRQITDSDLINQGEVNKLITSYASKAVEFDFVKTVKTSESKQSFLLDAVTPASQEFVVPSEVPDKSQWIPDNQVTLCMCCLLVSFSMFNRRHHCRRCGRVVCRTCSLHRMKVQGYKGVPVRVCQQCYYASHAKPEGDMRCSQSTDTFDSSSFTQEFHYWKLSTDPSRNSTIREEFSFEHSPNVSLCLAIFNLLPDATYSSLLLDESEKMLKLLQLNGKAGNPEVDCGVMIQIIRSLIIGAKVKYGQAGLTTGVVCCDRLLSQVDLLHLLIKNHCSRLIPTESLNNQTLRHLRDKLVEEELWDLALEVSTKCGLDRSGVWASWGKVCLAAGCWDEARLKFAHCLESVPKPSRNPPLVDEICRILESSPSPISGKPAQKTSDKNVTAQEVVQVLSTLKILTQGKSATPTGVSRKNSVQYEEQIFYLSTYGSNQGLIGFYMKHEEWKTALNFILQEQLDPEVFLDSLLLPSYKSEQQERLKSEIVAIDSSLEIFKKYLCHACLHLQKSGYLHTLYDLQLFMQDYVRAAVTCIHLYQRGASTYGELLNRASYLHSALRHLEEEMSALSKKTKRLDYVMKLDSREINRHMNTIWRQLEVAKFLGACESEGKPVLSLFSDQILDNQVPTLFDGNQQKMLLASLMIICGKNVPEGFGIAFRIMQDHQLDPEQVYLLTGKKLAEAGRIGDVEVLIDCVKTSGVTDVTSTCDNILNSCIPILTRIGSSNQDLEKLIKLITNADFKIAALIESRQLKSAYLLAVKHNRFNEIQRIMEIADELGQKVIKKICMKRLGLSQSPEGSICSSVPSCDSN